MAADASPTPPTSRERASPHKIALAILLHVYVSPRYPDPIFLGLPTSILDRNAIRHLQRFLVDSIKYIKTPEEPSLPETMQTLIQQVDPSGSLSKHLHTAMRAIDSPDTLWDVLESLKILLKAPRAQDTPHDVDTKARPTHIEGSGVFGVYLRRLLISCRSNFEALSRLFHDLACYLDDVSITENEGNPINSDENSNPAVVMFPTSSMPTTASLQFGQGSIIETREQQTLSDPTENTLNGKRKSAPQLSTFTNIVSGRQLQLMLHRKALALESMIGSRAPSEIDNEVSAILDISPNLPRAHFVRLLNHMHNREYQGAVDALHTYFDFCVRAGGPTAAGQARPMMQYAVLNLAAVHFQFGFAREAMHAIQETVRVAQQNGDNVCVALALSWLFRLSAASGGQQTDQLIRRCLQRAHELSLHGTQGLTHLVAAQYRLLSPTVIATALPPLARSFSAYSNGSLPGARVRSVLSSISDGVDAASVALSAPLASAAAASARRPGMNAGNAAEVAGITAANTAASANLTVWHGAVDAGFEELLAVSGKAQLMRSTVWALHGNTTLAVASSRAQLQVHSEHGTSRDTRVALANLAMAQLTRGDLTALCPPPSASINTSSSRQRSAQSASQVSREDVYRPALRMLIRSRRLQSQLASGGDAVSQTICLLLHRWAVARGDVHMGVQLLMCLRALSPALQCVGGAGGDLAGDGLRVVVRECWIETLQMTGRLAEAYQAVHRAVAFAVDHQLFVHQLHLDLEHSTIFLKATPQVPTAALPFALRCLTLTSKIRHDTVNAAAALKLAEVHLQYGYLYRSLALVQRTLPLVLGHCSLTMQGEAYSLLGRIYLTLGNRDVTGGVAATSSSFSSSSSSSSSVKSSSDPSSSWRYRMVLLLLARAEGAFMSSMKCFDRIRHLRKRVEALYLLSVVSNALADNMRLAGLNVSDVDQKVRQRDAFAAKFLSLRRAAMTPMLSSVGLLGCTKALNAVAADAA